jgi:alpha-beta hydrolase superfamily lysophospholipase
MKAKGLTTDEIYYAAHSLGGIILAKWAEGRTDVKGMVLMGSFLERKRFSINDDGSYKLDW